MEDQPRSPRAGTAKRAAGRGCTRFAEPCDSRNNRLAGPRHVHLSFNPATRLGRSADCTVRANEEATIGIVADDRAGSGKTGAERGTLVHFRLVIPSEERSPYRHPAAWKQIGIPRRKHRGSE